MITFDRESPLPVSEQLVEQLRYQLGAGRYRPGERLPSTRVLAEQVGISFHTVRKAYQRLEAEGLLETRRGGGFHVRERPALTRAERMERGAAVVQDALQKLVALGLSEDETEYLIEEQRTYFDEPAARRKLLFAAPYRELAESAAEQLTGALQERVDAVAMEELGRHRDADVVAVPMPLLAAARGVLPDAEVVGLVVGWPHDVLERVARLGSADAVGLVTRSGDAVEPLTAMLRGSAGFGGPVFSLTGEADRARIEGLVRRADLVLYTPQVRRRLRPLLGERAHGELVPVVAAESLARAREAVGR